LLFSEWIFGDGLLKMKFWAEVAKLHRMPFFYSLIEFDKIFRGCSWQYLLCNKVYHMWFICTDFVWEAQKMKFPLTRKVPLFVGGCKSNKILLHHTENYLIAHNNDQAIIWN
jgi:hypothetical protein